MSTMTRATARSAGRPRRARDRLPRLPRRRDGTAVPRLGHRVGSATRPTESVSASPNRGDRVVRARGPRHEDPGTLTVGTDNPAFPPYFSEPEEGETATDPWEFGDPTNGRGFESARGLRAGRAARVQRGPGDLDPGAVQQLDRARPEGLRRLPRAGVVHRGAHPGRRPDRGLLLQQPGARDPRRTHRWPMPRPSTRSPGSSLAPPATPPASRTSPTRSSRPRSRASTTTTPA